MNVPAELRGRSDVMILAELRGKRVLAFCGLGNPVGFRQTLERCGADLIAFCDYPDHHEYTREEIDELRQRVQHLKPDAVVCTQKDLVKIEIDRLENVPLLALTVELQVLKGTSELHNLLQRHLPAM